MPPNSTSRQPSHLRFGRIVVLQILTGANHFIESGMKEIDSSAKRQRDRALLPPRHPLRRDEAVDASLEERRHLQQHRPRLSVLGLLVRVQQPGHDLVHRVVGHRAVAVAGKVVALEAIQLRDDKAADIAAVARLRSRSEPPRTSSGPREYFP